MEKYRYPVIIDTDIGDDMDDTWALVYMLASGLFDIVAISVVNYHTEYKAKLICKMLSLLHREDIPVLVAPSAPEPEGYREGQGKWVKDYDLSSFHGSIVREGYLDEMYRIVSRSQERVCIFELGPSTTIARLYRTYPEVVKKSFVYAMAGSVRAGYNGHEGAISEFNIAVDRPSAETVFASGWDYTLLPLDVCAMLRMEGEIYADFLKKQTVASSVVLDNYACWIEDEIFNNHFELRVSSSTLFDIVVPWFALFPENFKVKTTPFALDEACILRENEKGFPIKWAYEITNIDEMMRHSEECL